MRERTRSRLSPRRAPVPQKNNAGKSRRARGGTRRIRTHHEVEISNDGRSHLANHAKDEVHRADGAEDGLDGGDDGGDVEGGQGLDNREGDFHGLGGNDGTEEEPEDGKDEGSDGIDESRQQGNE